MFTVIPLFDECFFKAQSLKKKVVNGGRLFPWSTYPLSLTGTICFECSVFVKCKMYLFSIKCSCFTGKIMDCCGLLTLQKEPGTDGKVKQLQM